jgi:hypothetical protein
MMAATVYHGWRDQNGIAHVEADDRPLELRLDLGDHSPTGFEWGYGGSGPAQLALALLADALGDDALALRLHQRFKWKSIAPIPRDREWWMTDKQVRAIAAEVQLP